MASHLDLLSPTKHRCSAKRRKEFLLDSSSIITNNSMRSTRLGSKACMDLSHAQSPLLQVKRLRSSSTGFIRTTRSRKPLANVLSAALNGATATMEDTPVIEVASAEKVATAVTRKPPITPEQSKTPRPVVRGDRIRVFYDRSDDIFGKDREGAQGYWHGTVMAVANGEKNSNCRISLLFDNGDESDFDYPAEDDTIERLILCSEGPMQFLKGEITGMFAGIENPEAVDVGDLVLCNYLGQEKRYRGRIAAASANGTSCDVAYDDGDVRNQANYMLIFSSQPTSTLRSSL
jgi:hypothetical protein